MIREGLFLKKIDLNKVPEHVAIIMDGNGRWASKRGLPRLEGHRAGVKSVRRIVEAAVQIGVKYLTLFVFSAENWKRPPKEVSGLMNLFNEMIEKELPNLKKNNIKLMAIGRLEELPVLTQESLKRAIDETEKNEGLVLILALNYGGRAEIVDAVEKLVQKALLGGERAKKLSEKIFSNYLYTSNLPYPDLLIRTSGEMRVSNFLLWQIAYTEFWFTPVLWPDFQKFHFYKAIYDYQRRRRRFGGLEQD